MVAWQAPTQHPSENMGKARTSHWTTTHCRMLYVAESFRALQQFLPNINKVLSMSRVGSAGDLPLQLADILLLSHKTFIVVVAKHMLTLEDVSSEVANKHYSWEKWFNAFTNQKVGKLMEADAGSAMQFLQSKSLCVMPISLAAAIYHLHNEPEILENMPRPGSPS